MTRKFSEMLRFFGASALGYDMHQKNTIIGLNYVRGIAAILIILYHYTTRFYDICYKAGAEENHIGLWWGCWAVSVFFILSGFLTVYTLNHKTSIYTYIYKRAIRLYPAYWCAICLTTIVTRLYNVNMAVDNFSTIINFTMLQGFLGIKPVDGAYWTLRYELHFYVIIAIILLFKQTNRVNKISFVWISCVIAYHASATVIKDNIVMSLINIGIMAEYAHLFIIGVAICGIIKNAKDYCSWLNIILALCVHAYLRAGLNTFFILGVVVLFFFIIKKNFRISHDKIFIFLSEISYPLYLIHQKIGYTIMLNMKGRVHDAVSVVLAVVVSIILATLIHRYVEIPISNFSKKLLNKYSKSFAIEGGKYDK